MRAVNRKDLLDIADSLFYNIKHGDEEHQKWLRDKTYEWVFQTFGNRAMMTQEINFLTGEEEEINHE